MTNMHHEAQPQHEEVHHSSNLALPFSLAEPFTAAFQMWICDSIHFFTIHVQLVRKQLEKWASLTVDFDSSFTPARSRTPT